MSGVAADIPSFCNLQLTADVKRGNTRFPGEELIEGQILIAYTKGMKKLVRDDEYAGSI